MRVFRIADRRHPIFDSAGARRLGGRWNSPGRPMIYAAETFAGALLEVLVDANLGRLPRTHAVVEITIPEPVSRETARPEDVPGWDAADQAASRKLGDRWLQEQRSAMLLVPSLVAGGRERNALINPEHPDFRGISASDRQDVVWDERLFRR